MNNSGRFKKTQDLGYNLATLKHDLKHYGTCCRTIACDLGFAACHNGQLTLLTMNTYNEEIQWIHTMTTYNEDTQWIHTMSTYNGQWIFTCKEYMAYTHTWYGTQMQNMLSSGTHIGFVTYEVFRFERSFWHSPKPWIYQKYIVVNVFNFKLLP